MLSCASAPVIRVPPLYQRQVTPVTSPAVSLVKVCVFICYVAIGRGGRQSCADQVLRRPICGAGGQGDFPWLVHVGDLDGDLVVAHHPGCRSVGGQHHHLVSVGNSTFSTGILEVGRVAELEYPVLLVDGEVGGAIGNVCRFYTVKVVGQLSAKDQVMDVAPSGSVAVKVATAASPFSAKFMAEGPDTSGPSLTSPTVTLTIRSPVSPPTEARTVTS